MIYLNCTFEEKEEVKKLGARWDPKVKKWYIPSGINKNQFSKWLPAGAQDDSYFNLSEFCRNNSIILSKAKSFLECENYVINNFITPKGKVAGLVEYAGYNGNQYILYPSRFAPILLNNKDKINSFSIKVKPFIKPMVEDIKFEKLKIYNFVILDSETSGMNVDDEIIELSIFSPKGDELYHSFFKPEKKINFVASKVNNLYNKDLEYMPQFKDEWENIKQIVGNRIVLGHDIEYDYRILKQTFNRYNLNIEELDLLFKNRIDSLQIAKRYIKDIKDYRLDYLVNNLNIGTQKYYNSSYDCFHIFLLLQKIEKSLQGITEENKEYKKKKVKIADIILPFLEENYCIEDIIRNTSLTENQVNYGIENVLKSEYKEKAYYLLNEDKEQIILNVVNSLPVWDRKIKPIKENAPDNITYTEIKIAVVKNNL